MEAPRTEIEQIEELRGGVHHPWRCHAAHLGVEVGGLVVPGVVHTTPTSRGRARWLRMNKKN